eukprot:gene22457-30714_t
MSAFFKRLAKGFNNAGDKFFTGVASSPVKQTNSAIIHGDESTPVYTDLAVDDIVTSLSSDLDLTKLLHLSVSHETEESGSPLHLSAQFAMHTLVVAFLEKGCNPNKLNTRNENALHALCRSDSNPTSRASILTTLIQWDSPGYEKISINQVDVTGNTPLHYAARNGLLSCVEQLLASGAIISIVNNNNYTCCEMADETGHKQLASMLELALVFQPVDKEMEKFLREQTFPSENQPELLHINAFSLSSAWLSRFIEESIDKICETCSGNELITSRARAEVLLQKYNWDANKLQVDLTVKKNVPAAANLSTITATPTKKSTAAKAPVKEAAVGVCDICGDSMLKPVFAKIRNSNLSSKPMRTELKCQSGHTYCVECWSQYLSVQVNDHGAGTLKCPGVKCDEILDVELAPLLLKSPALVTKFMVQRQRSIQYSVGLKNCINESCGLYLYLPPTHSADESSGARSAMYYLQQWPWALSVLLAAASLALHLLANANVATTGAGTCEWEEVANAKWIAMHAKPCPRCNAPIEKNEGCNHMSCRKCKQEFCWICMKSWNGHSSCNTAAVVQAERLHDLGKRFFHFFNWYQSHGEIAKIEMKLKSETMVRIMSGLKACSRSSSKASVEPTMIWLQGNAVENPILSQNAKSNPSSNRYLPQKECLKFLEEGFDELLKCRSFLQWSYPFAYFEFDDSEDSSSRRVSFEILQADLEARVVTLSDVVARRRLRAGRSQISLATRAAKSKRIELEHYMPNATAKIALKDRKNKSAHKTRGGEKNSSSTWLEERVMACQFGKVDAPSGAIPLQQPVTAVQEEKSYSKVQATDENSPVDASNTQKIAAVVVQTSESDLRMGIKPQSAEDHDQLQSFDKLSEQGSLQSVDYRRISSPITLSGEGDNPTSIRSSNANRIASIFAVDDLLPSSVRSNSRPLNGNGVAKNPNFSDRASYLPVSRKEQNDLDRKISSPTTLSGGGDNAANIRSPKLKHARSRIAAIFEIDDILPSKKSSLPMERTSFSPLPRYEQNDMEDFGKGEPFRSGRSDVGDHIDIQRQIDGFNATISTHPSEPQPPGFIPKREKVREISAQFEKLHSALSDTTNIGLATRSGQDVQNTDINSETSSTLSRSKASQSRVKKLAALFEVDSVMLEKP